MDSEERTDWELLLTDRYTLSQISEELAKQGFSRASGLPWAWDDQKTGKRKTAHNCLHRTFHNSFYAGWATSSRFGIKMGEVRGNWEPIVNNDQFERGKQILLTHGNNKANFKRRQYLLRNLLWLKVNGKTVKMYGSTPSGSHNSFSYYRTNVEIDGKILRLPTRVVEDQIAHLLQGITLAQSQTSLIRETYKAEIKSKTQNDKAVMIEKLKTKLVSLEKEEARLARLFMAGKITEEVYDLLRKEWQEKSINLQASIKHLEFDARQHLDDLEVALALLTNIPNLWGRFREKERILLLRTFIKQIIINKNGEIISHKLHPPFVYLSSLADQLSSFESKEGGRSTIVSVSTPTATRTQVSASGGQRSIH